MPPPVPFTTADVEAWNGGRRFPESWRLLNDVELLDLPDPKFIVERILQERSFGVVYAPPGAGKTTFVAGLLTAIATGRDWFGHRVCLAGPSVYVGAEDPSGFKMRLRAAKRAAHLPLDAPIGVHTFPEALDLREPANVALFRGFLEHTFGLSALRIICIDTYAAATPGGNENNSEDTTTAMTHGQLLRDALGATVVYVHHTNASGNRERGHTAMRGAADFMISLTPTDDLIHVECSKQRNAAPFEKLLLKIVPASDGQGCVMRLASDVLPSAALTHAETKVLSVLRDTFQSATGATKTEWRGSCQDIPERTFYYVAKKLVEKGLVKPIGTHFRVVPQ